MKNVEIEIQVNIENSQALLEFLEKKGHFQSETHQIDEYFSPSHRSFIKVRPIKEWLRLRGAEGKHSINYKNWHFSEDGKSHHCDEYESQIEDPAQLRKILNVLGFTSIVKVDKLRKTWLYKDYEIAVDRVKGLGDFVEIEYLDKDKMVDPAKITAEMINFLKDIGCGKLSRNYLGYSFQLLFPEEVEFEEQ